MKRALGLFAAAPLVTLLTGLFRNPFIFSREATRYFVSYGFPFSWWRVPTGNCQELRGPGISFFNPCQTAFSIPDFLINTVVFAILYLLVSQVAITLNRTVRPGTRNRTGRIFIFPRPSRSQQRCLVRARRSCGRSVPRASGKYSHWTISAQYADNARTVVREYT